MVEDDDHYKRNLMGSYANQRLSSQVGHRYVTSLTLISSRNMEAMARFCKDVGMTQHVSLNDTGSATFGFT